MAERKVGCQCLGRFSNRFSFAGVLALAAFGACRSFEVNDAKPPTNAGGSGNNTSADNAGGGNKSGETAGNGDPGGSPSPSIDQVAGAGKGASAGEAQGGSVSHPGDERGGTTGDASSGGRMDPAGDAGAPGAGGSIGSIQLLGATAPGTPLDPDASETYALAYYGELNTIGYFCPRQDGLSFCVTFGQGGSRPYALDSPAPCGEHSQPTEFAGFGVVHASNWYTSPGDIYWTFGLDEKYNGTRGVAAWPAAWNGVLVALELVNDGAEARAKFSIDWEQQWWKRDVVEIDFTPEGLTSNAPVYPVIGRWRRDYGERLGLYQNGTFYVDWDGDNAWNADSDHIMHFAAPGEYPAAADFLPGGGDEIALYRDGTWYIDANQNGSWDGLVGGDRVVSFGKEDGPGQIPTASTLPIVARDGWKRDCEVAMR